MLPLFVLSCRSSNNEQIHQSSDEHSRARRHRHHRIHSGDRDSSRDRVFDSMFDAMFFSARSCSIAGSNRLLFAQACFGTVRTSSRTRESPSARAIESNSYVSVAGKPTFGTIFAWRVHENTEHAILRNAFAIIDKYADDYRLTIIQHDVIGCFADGSAER
jgi:hypothetical protein